MAEVILSSRAKLRQLQKLMNDTWSVKLYIIWDRFTNPKQNTDYDLIVSYADTFYGHSGVIYKASNFKHVGMTTKGKVIDYKGKFYHDKCIRTYYINKSGGKMLKPFAQRVKDALECGEARYIEMPEKNIYTYPLRKVSIGNK